MRTCIATGRYFWRGETFINRHIERLFRGNTVVVCQLFQEENPYNKKVFAMRGNHLSVKDRIVAPGALLANRLRHGSGRQPFGSTRRDLIAFLRDQQVDIILAEFGTQALTLAPLANEMGLPIFSYFRGYDASKALRHTRKQEAYRRMMSRLAGVFSVSQFLLDNLARHGIRHPNAHVIPSGVDVGYFRPAEKRPLSCLAVGRFVEKKAPQITLRAFAEAAVDQPDARLDFVGDGPLLQACRALAAELGVAGRVTFHGSQPHEFVREKLATAQFFLQHSITAEDGNTEGLPTAIQEAMAAGCVVVSTRHAGIPEAVEEGSTGFLVDEHDQAGFAQAVRGALTRDDAAAMAVRAREVATARFDNEILLKRLEAEIMRSVGYSAQTIASYRSERGAP